VKAAALAWAGLAATLIALALLAWRTEPTVIDWQPALALVQPWRAYSAVAVHYSGLHLAANVAGAVLVAALGLAARVSQRSVWAWFVAWPLTHFALLLRPDLAHFGGMSGVLHAGVAVVAIELVSNGTTRQRVVAGAILAGLFIKVIGESPWGPPLRHPEGWDIAVAPLAHATGAVAGLACALAAQALPLRTMKRDGDG
jgi:rhomboid family GlyGly-CTERM serine protease